MAGREERRARQVDRAHPRRHKSPRPRRRGPSTMSFKEFVIQFFTWWNGQTLGTRFFTWRSGGFVGEDELGNRYYRARGHVIDPSMGPERRWVVYNGLADLSRVPPS